MYFLKDILDYEIFQDYFVFFAFLGAPN